MADLKTGDGRKLPRHLGAELNRLRRRLVLVRDLICELDTERDELLTTTPGVTVTLDAPDDLPALDADYALLVRALGNLIENAVKYSPDGGTVACRIGVDQVTGESPGAMIYTIADNGPGIPPERMADLFKRFGANDRSMSLSAGLGLAFVKKAVDLLGGTINCSSSCTGTTFRIALPIGPD